MPSEKSFSDGLSTTNSPSLTAHPHSNYHTHPIVILEISAMTARQSYHLTFARFSPSLSVKSFTAAEAANTAYRVEITFDLPQPFGPITATSCPGT